MDSAASANRSQSQKAKHWPSQLPVIDTTVSGTVYQAAKEAELLKFINREAGTSRDPRLSMLYSPQRTDISTTSVEDVFSANLHEKTNRLVLPAMVPPVNPSEPSVDIDILNTLRKYTLVKEVGNFLSSQAADSGLHVGDTSDSSSKGAATSLERNADKMPSDDQAVYKTQSRQTPLTVKGAAKKMQDSKSAGRSTVKPLSGAKLDEILKKRLEKVEQKLKDIRSKNPKHSVGVKKSSHAKPKHVKRDADRSIAMGKFPDFASAVTAEVNSLKRFAETVAGTDSVSMKKAKYERLLGLHANLFSDEIFNLSLIENKLAEKQLDKLLADLVPTGPHKSADDDQDVSLYGIAELSDIKVHFPKISCKHDGIDVGVGSNADEEFSAKLSNCVKELCSSTSDISEAVVPEKDANESMREYRFSGHYISDDRILEANMGTSSVHVDDHSVDQHLGCLSLETQYDSQFVESLGVKLTHLNVVKDWRNQKPLDLLIAGHLKDLPVTFSLVFPFGSTDVLVSRCLEELLVGMASLLDAASAVEESDSIQKVLDSLHNHFSDHLSSLAEEVMDVCDGDVPYKGYEEIDNLEEYSYEECVRHDVTEKGLRKKSSLGAAVSSLLTSLIQELEEIRDNCTQNQRDVIGTGNADVGPCHIGSLSSFCEDTEKRQMELAQSNVAVASSQNDEAYSPTYPTDVQEIDPMEYIKDIIAENILNATVKSVDDVVAMALTATHQKVGVAIKSPDVVTSQAAENVLQGEVVETFAKPHSKPKSLRHTDGAHRTKVHRKTEKPRSEKPEKKAKRHYRTNSREHIDKRSKKSMSSSSTFGFKKRHSSEAFDIIRLNLGDESGIDTSGDTLHNGSVNTVEQKRGCSSGTISIGSSDSRRSNKKPSGPDQQVPHVQQSDSGVQQGDSGIGTVQSAAIANLLHMDMNDSPQEPDENGAKQLADSLIDGSMLQKTVDNTDVPSVSVPVAEWQSDVESSLGCVTLETTDVLSLVNSVMGQLRSDMTAMLKSQVDMELNDVCDDSSAIRVSLNVGHLHKLSFVMGDVSEFSQYLGSVTGEVLTDILSKLDEICSKLCCAESDDKVRKPKSKNHEHCLKSVKRKDLPTSGKTVTKSRRSAESDFEALSTKSKSLSHQSVALQDKDKLAASKGMRFMQAFRQNQIAKRRNQRAADSSSGQIVFSTSFSLPTYSLADISLPPSEPSSGAGGTATASTLPSRAVSVLTTSVDSVGLSPLTSVANLPEQNAAEVVGLSAVSGLKVKPVASSSVGPIFPLTGSFHQSSSQSVSVVNSRDMSSPLTSYNANTSFANQSHAFGAMPNQHPVQSIPPVPSPYTVTSCGESSANQGMPFNLVANQLPPSNISSSLSYSLSSSSANTASNGTIPINFLQPPPFTAPFSSSYPTSAPSLSFDSQRPGVPPASMMTPFSGMPPPYPMPVSMPSPAQHTRPFGLELQRMVSPNSAAGANVRLGEVNVSGIYSSPSSQARQHRIYVFNLDKPVCHEVQHFLVSVGARVFDPFNVVLLRAFSQVDCRVLLHSDDLGIVQFIPNLLRLKRDLRVSFVSYNNVDNVAQLSFSAVFPRGGLIIIDSGTLIGSRSENLMKMCEFMQRQKTEKATPWLLTVSPGVMADLDRLRASGSGDALEFAKLSEMITKYRNSGIIDWLPEDLCRKHHLSVMDYQRCCVALQSRHLYKYRHFLFVTDMPRTHPLSRCFVENGVDVMSVADFMRGFVGCTAVPTTKHIPGNADHFSPLFADAHLSNGTEALMNKWVLPTAVMR